jgi:hypothetical protein
MSDALGSTTSVTTPQMSSPRRRPLLNDPEGLKRAARAILDGRSKTSVLIEAGYSPKQARKCKLPKMLVKAIAANGRQYQEIGKDLNVEVVTNTIKGRLFHNVVTGESKGIDAAKALGSMKEYQLFQPDSLTGVIVLQQPSLALAGKPIQVIDSKDLIGDD